MTVSEITTRQIAYGVEQCARKLCRITLDGFVMKYCFQNDILKRVFETFSLGGGGVKVLRKRFGLESGEFVFFFRNLAHVYYK